MTHQTIVKINSELFRPAEVDSLTGDASKARLVLGWRPKVEFEQLVYMMMDKDLERVRQKKVNMKDNCIVCDRIVCNYSILDPSLCPEPGVTGLYMGRGKDLNCQHLISAIWMQELRKEEGPTFETSIC